MVYVVVFIRRGVMEGLEVFTDRDDAEQRADEWGKKVTPDEGVVDVLEREIKIDLAKRFPNMFRD